jgi:hypothetical protein
MVKAGIVTADLELLPDAPIAENNATETSAPETRSRTDLFTVNLLP